MFKWPLASLARCICGVTQGDVSAAATELPDSVVCLVQIVIPFLPNLGLYF